MPCAALILASLDDDANAAQQPLLLTLGGQTLLERLIDQARRIGCSHVVICAGSLPGALLSAVARCKGKGGDVSLARSPREAADLLHPQEQVLLLANAFVMPDDRLKALLDDHQPALSTLPEAWGRDRFERIDAIDNWSGAALLPAGLVRETVAMLGGWAFGPTLLRRAVQIGLPRRPLGIGSEAEADHIAPIQREDLAGTAAALVAGAQVPTDGALERYLGLPAMRALAGKIALKPVTPNITGLLALLLGLIGLGTAAIGLAALAMICLTLASLPALLSGLLGHVGSPAGRLLASLLQSRRFWVPAALFLLAARLAWLEDPLQPIVLLLVWTGLHWGLLLHLAARTGIMPIWWLGAPGLAVVFGVMALLGLPLIGLGLCLAGVMCAQLSIQIRLGHH